ncbi:MAG: type II toxin-antitoxin system HicA family toxin [Sphingorhabdus sp.]
MQSKEVLRLLKAAGWKEVRQTGSHKHLRHSDVPGTVTVPHPKSDLPIGTLKSIERQARMKLRN